MGLSAAELGRLKILLPWICIVFTACSMLSSNETTARPPAQPDPLPPEQTAFAEALASYSQGLLEALQGNSDGAVRGFLQAVTLDPDYDELYLRLAAEHLRRNESDQAVRVIERLVDRKPKAYKPYIWLGLMQRADGHATHAEETFKRAIKIKPRKPDAYIELATLYVRTGQDKRAVELLRQSASKVTAPGDLLRLLGDIYLRMSQTGSSEETEQNNREAAIQTYEKAIAETPDDLTLLLQLGNLYLFDDQVNKAIDYFERIEKLEPDNIEIQQKLARSFEARGDNQKAIETLEKILQRHPANPQINYYLGELYEKLGQQEQAVRFFEMAAENTRDDWAPYLRLALIHMVDNPDQAIDSLKNGLERDPDNIQLNEILAYIYLNNDEYTNALQRFDAASTAINETGQSAMFPYFHFNYTLAAYHTARHEKAARQLVAAINLNAAFLDAFVEYMLQTEPLENLQSAIHILTLVDDLLEAPNVTEGHRALLSSIQLTAEPDAQTAAAYLKATIQTNRFPLESYFQYALARDADYRTHALDCMLTTAESVTNDLLLCTFIGLLGNHTENYQTALEYFQKAQAIDQEQNSEPSFGPNFYFWMGIALDNLDRFFEAEQYFERCIKLDPNHATALNYLAYSWAEKDMRLDTAMDYIKRALEIEPESGAFLDTLGWIYYRLEQYEDALEYIQKARAQMPEDPTILEHLGDVYEKLQRYDDARRAWIELLEVTDEKKRIEEKLNMLPSPGIEVPAQTNQVTRSPIESE